MIPTASPIEVLQLVAALVGAAFNLWGLVMVYLDRDELRAKGYNGPREFWATSRVGQKWILLSAQLILVAIGIVSVKMPPPGGGEVLSTQATFVRIGIAMVSVLLAAFAVKVRHDRERVVNWGPKDQRQQ